MELYEKQNGRQFSKLLFVEKLYIIDKLTTFLVEFCNLIGMKFLPSGIYQALDFFESCFYFERTTPVYMV